MNLKSILLPVGGVILVALAYRAYGWAGVAVAAGGIVMWVLLNFTRMMTVLRRAAEQPVGYVASAVMLNAKLRPGVTLMHVVAMTRSLGALRSPKDTQPEVFRWTDNGASFVDCEFRGGKLVRWSMVRPAGEPSGGVEAPSASAQPPAP